MAARHPVCIVRLPCATAGRPRVPTHLPYPRDLFPRPRRLRQPGDGALGQLAPAADRDRHERHGGRRLDHRVGLHRHARLDAVDRRADRRPLSQVPADRGRHAPVWRGGVPVRARAEPHHAGDRAGRFCGLRRLDHSARHGVHRRRDAVRTAPAGARALHVGPDQRPIVRPGGGRHHRRLARLARDVLRAGGVLRHRGGRAVPRARDQPDHAPAAAERGEPARHPGELRPRAEGPVGAHRLPRSRHRDRARVRRLRLCGRRFAPALRPRLHAGGPGGRDLRGRRPDLCPDGEAAGGAARTGRPRHVWKHRARRSPT